jgi:hypothetical protein
MGTRDKNGTLNVYIETNTFYGGSNQAVDCDDACRLVFRYNTLTYTDTNSHGEDTSPFGERHWEIYDNTYTDPQPAPTCSGNTSCVGNIVQEIWIRGATGVIFDNTLDDIAGNYWGDKSEAKFNIRGAEDVRPQGSCAQVAYPVPHQLGQNNDGTKDFTDPIWVWGNKGTLVIGAGWEWGNPCGFNYDTFFQWGRDGIDNDSKTVDPNGSGTNAAKPGYTPYTYPHPLAQ